MGWDGWDGWDGWSVHFFFLSYLGNYQILFLNVSDPLNIVLCTSFNIFFKKKSYFFFFNFAKIEFFFGKIFTSISHIFQKQLNIFFSLCLVPLEEFLRHLLENSEKKNRNIFFSKNFEQLFFLRKNKFLQKFLKYLGNHSIFSIHCFSSP